MICYFVSTCHSNKMNPSIIITSQEFDQLPFYKKDLYEPNNKINTTIVDYICCEYKKKRDEDAIVDIMLSNIITSREYNKLTNELQRHFEPYKTKNGNIMTYQKNIT